MRRSIGIHFRTSPFSSLYQRFQFASDLLDPIMFADNTNLLNSNKDINTVFHRVNDELQKINVWFISNKLSLNMKKKNKYSFYYKPNRKDEYIENKISKNIGISSKARLFLSKKSLLSLYYTYIHSYINYGRVSWGTTCRTNLKKTNSQ